MMTPQKIVLAINMMQKLLRLSTFWLFLPCLIYLAVAACLNNYVSLSVDEFWFAHRIYQYKDGLPYRDFAPYKTVLGYYLLLLPMLFTNGIFKTLIFTKQTLALVNTIIFCIAAVWLNRFFDKKAVIGSLVLLLTSDIVLSYATNIRVDLLSYWFCFFSLLFLLDKRFLIAGLLLGLGFATSQKSIWYLFASNAALLTQWFYGNVSQKNSTIRPMIIFNLAAASMICTYLILWSLLSNWHTVIDSVFYEASIMYHLDWYDSGRRLFWSYIILYNPFLFLVWPLTFISLFVTYDNDHTYQTRLALVTYAFVVLACLMPYKQVFPYYMQVTIPIFLTLYAAFFHWVQALFIERPKLCFILNKAMLTCYAVIYLGALIWAYLFFNLPDGYLLICALPMLLMTYLLHYDTMQARLLYILFTSVVMVIGLIYPISLYIGHLSQVNGDYQKANIEMTRALLSDGSQYVAGIELFYDQTQPIPGMRHLMGPAIDFLAMPTEKLRKVMLASLYGEPTATSASVIAAFKTSHVKLYVNNYRMMALPPIIKNYLASQYEHYWGSIYLYAPEVPAGRVNAEIKFTGQYQIESLDDLVINHKHYQPQALIHIHEGHIHSEARQSYRLKLIPSIERPKISGRDEWEKIIL